MNLFFEAKIVPGRSRDGFHLIGVASRRQVHGSLRALARPECFRRFLRQFFAKECVIYAKRTAGGAERVFRDLAGHTHRVAISHHRLVGFKLSFRPKHGVEAKRKRQL